MHNCIINQHKLKQNQTSIPVLLGIVVSVPESCAGDWGSNPSPGGCPKLAFWVIYFDIDGHGKCDRLLSCSSSDYASITIDFGILVTA